MTIDSKVQPREGESLFDARCRAVGVNPSKTSLHVLECYESGLDPKKTSMHALKCTKYGLDPKKTLKEELIRVGSQLYKCKR